MPLRLGRVWKKLTAWEPSSKFTAQMAHTFVASTAILAADKHGWNVLDTFGGIVLFALIKEFIFDIYISERDSWLGSACDFDFYILGGLLGILATVMLWPTVALTLLFVLPMTWIDVKYPGMTTWRTPFCSPTSPERRRQ